MDSGFKNWAHPTYNEMQQACNHIAEFIHFNPTEIGKVDIIAGVSRGGLMPAVILSHRLNIPMTTIEYSSKSGMGDNKNHLNKLPELKGKRILLIEDIVDSGNTMKEIYDIYKNNGCDIFTASVYYKSRRTIVHEPDVWAIKVSENFGWIHFPFETQTK